MITKMPFMSEPSPTAQRTPIVYATFWCTVVAVLAILMTRHPDVWMNPQLTWEDGRIFLAEGIVSQGAESWFRPFVGYFHLLPKMICSVFTPFDLIHAPLILNSIALLMMAIGFSMASGRSVAGMLPRAIAVSLALLCALMPWHTETFGMITNLHWYIFPSMCICAVSDPDRMGKVSKILAPIVLIAAIFTSPNVVLTLPIFGLRVLLESRRRTYAFYFFLGIVLLIGFKLILVRLLAPLSSEFLKPDYFGLARYMVKGVGYKVVFNNVMGARFFDGGVPQAWSYRVSFWVFAALVASIPWVNPQCRFRGRQFVLYLLSIYFLLAPILLAGLLRPQYIHHFVYERHYYGADRYFITPSLFFFLLVLLWIQGWLLRPATRKWALILLVPLLVHHWSVVKANYAYTPLPDAQWHAQVLEYYRTLHDLNEDEVEVGDVFLIRCWPFHEEDPYTWSMRAPLFVLTPNQRVRVAGLIAELEQRHDGGGEE